MKLQPNFSWQKYVNKPENEKEQFQFQLSTQHILAANAINATIDDASFWLRQRQTSFTWVNNKPIYTVTIPTSAWTAGGTVNTIPLQIASVNGFQVLYIIAEVNNGKLSTSTTLPLPYLDPITMANSIGIKRVGTNVILTSGGTNYSTYSGYITVYYIYT